MSTPTNFAAILQQAHDAAVAAQAGMVEGTGLDCGFAWVTIPGTDPLARFCREQLKVMGPEKVRADWRYARLFGDRGYPRGWQFWEPGAYPGQSIGIHLAGAQAFNAVLAEFNIRGTVGSRYD